MSLFYDIVFAVIYKMHSLSEHISDELSQNSTNCCLYCKFTSSSPDTNRQQKVKHFLPRKRISDLLWASSFWRAMAHQEKKLSFRISITWQKKKKKNALWIQLRRKPYTSFLGLENNLWKLQRKAGNSCAKHPEMQS